MKHYIFTESEPWIVGTINRNLADGQVMFHVERTLYSPENRALIVHKDDPCPGDLLELPKSLLRPCSFSVRRTRGKRRPQEELDHSIVLLAVVVALACLIVSVCPPKPAPSGDEVAPISQNYQDAPDKAEQLQH